MIFSLWHWNEGIRKRFIYQNLTKNVGAGAETVKMFLTDGGQWIDQVCAEIVLSWERTFTELLSLSKVNFPGNSFEWHKWFTHYSMSNTPTHFIKKTINSKKCNIAFCPVRRQCALVDFIMS